MVYRCFYSRQIAFQQINISFSAPDVAKTAISDNGKIISANEFLQLSLFALKRRN